MRSSFLVFGLLTISAFPLVPRDARAADGVGFGVPHFQPSERGSEWFVLDTLDLRGNRPALGVVGDYSYRSLVIFNPDGTVAHSVVRNQLFLHPGASMVLFDRLRVGADLPVLAYGDGHAGDVDGTHWSPAPHEQALGDLRLGLDVRLLGAYGDPFTLAIGGQVWAPTGSESEWTGDGAWRVGPHMAVAGDIGQFVYAVRTGFTYHDRNEPVFRTQFGSTFDFAGSVGVRAVNRKLVVGPEIFGDTVTDGDVAFKRSSTPIEGLFGLHYTFGDLRAGGGIGTGLTRGLGAPAARVVANLEWTPAVAPRDGDGDGVPDDQDACPAAAGPRTEDPATNGCPPPPPKDTDRDGVLDDVDACKDVPGIATQDPKTNGCPDQDKDGIPDGLDACRDVAGAPSDDPAKNGCPPDSDGDGVLDAQDACPATAGIKTSDPHTNGCPDTDIDKDGVPNDKDACPDQAGKPDPDPKKNGCPMAFVEGKQIKITQQVKFKTGSAVIDKGKDSEDVLGAILEVLKAHPEIEKVSVEGHTDNRGSAATNKKLSAARAASVVTWLTQHGIDKARLASVGYGSERPVDTNDTEAGRQNNRRVELHIVGDDAAKKP